MNDPSGDLSATFQESHRAMESGLQEEHIEYVEPQTGCFVCASRKPPATFERPAVRVPKLIKEYIFNVYTGLGMGALVLLLGVLYLIINSLIMPSFTRHGVSIEVPDVINFSSEDAAEAIKNAGLRPEQIVLRKPNLPRNIVIDQSPGPNSQVKPGRHVYLTVNTGDTTTVLIPKVESYGIRVASNMLMLNDLIVGKVLPDSIPSFYVDTITSQDPPAGSRVPPGTIVNLRYGTGLGDKLVLVPDVTHMSVDEAKTALLDMRLRSVVIGTRDDQIEKSMVLEQSPEAETSVSEGYEIRLYLKVQNDE